MRLRESNLVQGLCVFCNKARQDVSTTNGWLFVGFERSCDDVDHFTPYQRSFLVKLDPLFSYLEIFLKKEIAAAKHTFNIN